MPNPLLDQWDKQGVGKVALADKNGTEWNASNPLPTTATITGDVNVDPMPDTNGLIGKPSGGDFTTAYASATTITLGTYPDGTSVTHDDILMVVQIATGGTVTATYARDDAGMSIAANVITVAGASFVASDSFVIYTNVPRWIGGNGTVSTQVQRFTDAGVPTATLTNVNDAASSTQLLAANTNRKGAYFYNDSTVALYINFGATASTTAFTVKVASQGFYEMPLPVYTGVINGIWDSDASGAVRITELT